MEGDELEPLWRRDGLAHAGHLIIYPDTRELVVGDWREPAAMRHPLVRPGVALFGRVLSGSARARRASLRTGNDQLVVLDLDTGAEKGRVVDPLPLAGLPLPGPRIRTRRLLPVADHDRARSRRLAADRLTHRAGHLLGPLELRVMPEVGELRQRVPLAADP